jgi:hypothetical protein
MFFAPGHGHNAVEHSGNIKHCSIGGQDNRQDDEDDLKDATRGKRTHGGADCEDRANRGRKERMLQFAPGAALYVVLLLHATKVTVSPFRAPSDRSAFIASAFRSPTTIGTDGFAGLLVMTASTSTAVPSWDTACR